MNRIVSPSVSLLGTTRVSWGAVFVGFLLSVMTYLFLSVLGTAIGASVLDPAGERNPLAGFGTGTGIWVGVSTLISIAVGAFFAGRSAPNKGALHGVLSWSIMTIATLVILTSVAGSIVGTASSVASQGVALAGKGIAAAAPSMASGVSDVMKKNGVDFNMSDMQGQLETLMRQSGKPALDPANVQNAAKGAASDATTSASDAAASPQAASDSVATFFTNLKQRAEPALTSADKDALVNIIMARTGKSRPEAEQIATNYEQTYNQALQKWQDLKQQAEQKARQAAEATAEAVSKAAWAAAILLLLGVIVSGIAGHFGRRSNPLRDEAVV